MSFDRDLQAGPFRVRRRARLAIVPDDSEKESAGYDRQEAGNSLAPYVRPLKYRSGHLRHLHEKLEDAPERNYDCPNYEVCLSLAAALDWESFTCHGCSQCINKKLLWKAGHRLREEDALGKICGSLLKKLR